MRRRAGGERPDGRDRRGATLADPSNPLIIDSLYATFRLQAWAGTIKACAVCWDALVPKERGGGVTDASRLAWNTAMVIRRSFSAPMSASVPATCISTIRSPPWAAPRLWDGAFHLMAAVRGIA